MSSLIRHATVAVPWGLFTVTALVLVALVEVVEQWPWQVWPLQGVAVGLVAATAMFAFDEPAASVVDTLPRGLRWRTGARGAAVVLLVGWWVLLVTLAQDAWFGHPWAVAGQGVAGAVLATAAVTSLRRRGWSSPAGTASAVVTTVVVFVALLRPWQDDVPLFPYAPDAPWTASAWIWGAAGVAGVAWLAVSLRENRTPATGMSTTLRVCAVATERTLPGLDAPAGQHCVDRARRDIARDPRGWL